MIFSIFVGRIADVVCVIRALCALIIFRVCFGVFLLGLGRRDGRDSCVLHRGGDLESSDLALSAAFVRDVVLGDGED